MKCCGGLCRLVGREGAFGGEGAEASCAEEGTGAVVVVVAVVG